VRELVKTVTEWVRDLVVISLTFAFVEMLLPANDLRRFARVVMGIIMIAVIIGSVLDISSAIDDALESQAGFTFGETGTLDRLSWIAKGELITYAGLEVVEGEAERKIASQVESIARLASGSDEARAEIKFTPAGDIRRIDVALLNLAIGITPEVAQPISAGTDPFDHPDAQRRFRVMNNVEELERALEYPWEKWAVFLHPAQRELVERSYSGPARVSGSAGTGKTVVALHRAVFLARENPGARVLLTTFSDTLANSLKTKLRSLVSNEPRIGERIEVHSMNAVGRRLFELNSGRPNIAPQETVRQLLARASEEVNEHSFSLNFLMAEWEDVVDAWQLESWEAYRDVLRLGRKTRLPEKRRATLWTVFERVRLDMKARNLITYSDLFGLLASYFSQSGHSPYDFIVVDEAQDVSVPQLRFLASLGGWRPEGLFFAGDLGQRIFQQPFSWKALGVDIRGRSRTLRVNYRTSHQIRMQADQLLEPELADVDGNVEGRRGTISVFNGPEPTIMVLESRELEIDTVSVWLMERLSENVAPHEIGVFVRSAAEIDRACAAAEKAGVHFRILDENVEVTRDHVSISTMHLAKGLEFRAVTVMACDDDVIPLQKRIETVSDVTDLEEVYNTERHLLYVACTRARDHLLVTSVDPASEFLDDLRM
jgi:superfamily I DNA/RNA helicase